MHVYKLIIESYLSKDSVKCHVSDGDVPGTPQLRLSQSSLLNLASINIVFIYWPCGCHTHGQ